MQESNKKRGKLIVAFPNVKSLLGRGRDKKYHLYFFDYGTAKHFLLGSELDIVDYYCNYPKFELIGEVIRKYLLLEPTWKTAGLSLKNDHFS